MSQLISIRRKPQVQVDTSRMRRIPQACRQGASNAAERLGPAAQRSRAMAADRVLLAREWGAPRLERAAGYVESDLAPRVGSFLTSTAHRMDPSRPRHRARNATVAMLGVMAAAGMAGAVLTRRRAMRSLPEEFAEPPRAPVTPVGDGQVRSA